MFSIFQFQGNDREFSFIKVIEEAGAWLSLLRPAEHTVSYNTSVSFEGKQLKMNLKTCIRV